MFLFILSVFVPPIKIVSNKVTAETIVTNSNGILFQNGSEFLNESVEWIIQ